MGRLINDISRSVTAVLTSRVPISVRGKTDPISFWFGCQQFLLPLVSISQGLLSQATFPITGESLEFHFLMLSLLEEANLRVLAPVSSPAVGVLYLLLHFIMSGSSKRFVAIESKSFDLAVVGSEEDTLKIFENGRRTFIIFRVGSNERGWARIFDALTEIANPSLGSTGALNRSPPPRAIDQWCCASTSTSTSTSTSGVLS
ncbi:hypothetical protein Cgig2_000304 [Carnegiea gigantea]|uniref:Uncharacterized protein n=1 Tax=Carnegiea gigantea TaxID=171969 RepID=A0A9Q1GM41_9CARY|nr:hypothetical protein Cgig2_000304 [Carnegiea gigantea]